MTKERLDPRQRRRPTENSNLPADRVQRDTQTLHILADGPANPVVADAGARAASIAMSALKPNQKVSVMALDHRTGNVGPIMVSLGAENRFRKARESFLQNNSREAAVEIRKAAADMKSEADQAAEGGREILEYLIFHLSFRTRIGYLSYLFWRLQSGIVPLENFWPGSPRHFGGPDPRMNPSVAGQTSGGCLQ